MPELSRFYGIVIRMFAEAGGPHHTPHFHAYWQGQVAVVGFDPVGVLAGALPAKQRRLAEAWAELHQGELRDAWARLQGGQAPASIAPLA
ncbi:MAG TPA: DUF4160 domain-containing protein [Gemmatirosa sp.]